ncbi:circadian-associated transcriptional repressor [Eublepharis macularius]|uniref:Circadian-associated transcriptional repressor n=1 Tax=Eublepharis macularius TaxID=481883 RepID=A0AA97L3N1_EUBMA|nr:circadian-associated transcriptional repressor [Eublepharis macularius]
MDSSRESLYSSMSVSSRESLYSIDSATSEEEDDEHCASFEVFLSDSGSDPEKEGGPLKSRRDAYPDGPSFLGSLKSRQTNPGFLCQGHERCTQKSLGLLASARLRPSGRCCRYPAVLGKPCCTHLRDADGRLPRKAASQSRMESNGRKRPGGAVGGSQSPEHMVQPSLAGFKRHRSKALEAREDPCPFGWTEGDQLFAQKCRELRGFILPLQELLIRLKMGRFDRGLSTFQQSVAMDRIQRIIGVLQKPGMGERYLGTLLQVERMLKVWFPHVALKSSCADGDIASENTSEMAKKSLSADSAVPRRAASSHDSAESPPTEKLHQTHLTDASPDSESKAGALWGEPTPFLADWPTMNLTWIHTSPISNPPLGHVNSAFGQALLGPAPQSTYGIVLFLHNSPAPFVPSDRSTSVTPALPPQACFHSSRLLPSTGELPRCQSLPGTTQGDSSLPSGSLACHSRSLPRLPTSGEKLSVASEGLPYYSNS